MAEKHALLRKPAGAGQRPAAPRKPAAPAAVRSAPAAPSLRQRLGNRGAQLVAARLAAGPARAGGAAGAAAGGAPLALSRPGDAHEREAERMADKVMRTAQPVPGAARKRPVLTGLAGALVHRRCAACASGHPLAEPDAMAVHRQAAAPAVDQVAPSVAADIRALQGGGSALPPAALAFFEPRFGADFGRVRVHTDSAAARSADAIGARAYTVGRDIAFGAGQFSPDSQAGRHLLAHELTHVVQQEGATAAPALRRQAADAKPAVQDDPGLLSQLEAEIATWEAGAAQDEDLMLRAQASRMVLLLKGWGPKRPALLTQQDLDGFMSDSRKRAATELGTLGLFAPGVAEFALMLHPKGFPLTWSGRVRAALTLGTDPVAALKAEFAEVGGLLLRSVALSAQLAAHGLPVPFEKLERLDGFRLTIADAKAEKPSPVRDYAREGIRYVQLKWVRSFAVTWELMTDKLAEAVAEGTLVPKYADWKEFVDNKRDILLGLPERARERVGETEDDVKKLQTDALKLGDAALAVGVASSLSSVFAILDGWKDVTLQFDTALEVADTTIAASAGGDHLVKAPTWAWENGYLKGAALATGKAMLEQGPEALAEMALLFGLGMVPPLEIPLAVYLRIRMGVDVAQMLVELATTVDEIVKARTVAALQGAGARLAALLVRAALFGAIIALTWGLGKAVGRLKRNKEALKKANPALTEEEATRKAMEQLSKEEREALGGTKAGLARRIAEKIEQFAGACRLGSVICEVVPAAIQKEAGPLPPTRYNVPAPKGALRIQHSALATANRNPAFLQKQVLSDPQRWPHFVKAMAENGGKWPVDAKGVAWQVHHIKPAGMGGGSEIDNLFPLPQAEHALLTNYWNRVRLAIENRFTKAEWDAIYTSSAKDVSGADVPESRLPKSQR